MRAITCPTPPTVSHDAVIACYVRPAKLEVHTNVEEETSFEHPRIHCQGVCPGAV